MVAKNYMATINVPKVFLDQYGPDFMQKLLNEVAEQYENWELSDVGALVVLREYLRVLTTTTEDLDSITDTSPREAMYGKACNPDWGAIRGSCAEMLVDNYDQWADDDDEADAKLIQEIEQSIDEYVKSTPNCYYDNFYAMHYGNFSETLIKQRDWKDPCGGETR